MSITSPSGTQAETETKKPVAQKVMERLRTIELILKWEGAINGTQLAQWFGITTRRASQDLALYASYNPTGMSYSTSLKRYVVRSDFSPYFSANSEQDYLNHLRVYRSDASSDSVSFEPTGLESFLLPMPKTSPSVFRTLVRSIRLRGAISFRVIVEDADSDRLDYLLYERASPLRLVHLPIGWCMRFYDHEKKAFDVVRVNRIYNGVIPAYNRANVPHDDAWEGMKWFIAEPKAGLSEAKTQLVLADWGITDSSRLMVPVREALSGIMLALLNNLDERVRFRIVPMEDRRWIADPVKDQEIELRMRHLRTNPVA
jgi:predicted DNA-binding transcriptional regulator YafY